MIALDTAVRAEGIPALSLFDCVFDVFAPDQRQTCQTHVLTNAGRRKDMSLWKVDYLDLIGYPVARRGKLIIFEDNDAVIRTVIKGRSMALRHTSHTQRVVLDWLLERLREDGSMSLRHVKTQNKWADILTNAQFSGPQLTPFVSSCSRHPFYPQWYQLK